MGGGRNGTPFRSSEEGTLRMERSCFSLTTYASEACDPYTPKDHIKRAPTIVWDPYDTQPVFDLHSTPMDPGGDDGEDLDPLGPPPIARDFVPLVHEEAKVGQLCYFYPTLQHALSHGPAGAGHPHVRPPASLNPRGDDGGDNGSPFPRVVDCLTQVQLRLLDSQNTANRTSLRRLVNILRQHRSRRQAGTFRLLDFMQAFDTECGFRLVHIAVTSARGGGKTATTTTTYDAAMAYSIDQGGRFYIAIRCVGLGPPQYGEDPQRRARTPAEQYWSDARITPETRIEFCRYACPCSINTINTS